MHPPIALFLFLQATSCLPSLSSRNGRPQCAHRPICTSPPSPSPPLGSPSASSSSLLRHAKRGIERLWRTKREQRGAGAWPRSTRTIRRSSVSGSSKQIPSRWRCREERRSRPSRSIRYFCRWEGESPRAHRAHRQHAELLTKNPTQWNTFRGGCSRFPAGALDESIACNK